MSKQSEETLRGVPMKPYDLLREGIIMLALLAAVIFLLAIVFGSPDYPTVRGEDVAKSQPIAYLKTSANFLAGKASIEGYGPPYTTDTAHAQNMLGIAPADWLGVTIPLDPVQDFVLKPLARAAVLNNNLDPALQTYESATPDQQAAWAAAYLAALEKATVSDGQVQIPAGDYGPVATLMNGMLGLGRAGLLEGALESSARLPYSLDFTRSLLFFQDSVYAGVAEKLDMTGEQWGVSHETGPYPGAWWLWPYTFLYQIPFLSASPNVDLLAGAIMSVVFLVMLLIPFVPILNRLPRWVGIYRLVWRDWYARDLQKQSESSGHSR